FGEAHLGLVELLENDDREVNVVFLKPQDRGRVVDEYVGVEYEYLSLFRHRSSGLQAAYGLEHLVDVSRDLHAAELAAQGAAPVEDERRALDAHVGAPVERLLADHAERAAELLVGIGDELERETVLRLEALVRREAVARDAVDHRIEPAELVVAVADVAAFPGAARRVVLGIEVEHDVAALEAREIDLSAARGLDLDVGKRRDTRRARARAARRRFRAAAPPRCRFGLRLCL